MRDIANVTRRTFGWNPAFSCSVIWVRLEILEHKLNVLQCFFLLLFIYALQLDCLFGFLLVLNASSVEVLPIRNIIWTLCKLRRNLENAVAESISSFSVYIEYKSSSLKSRYPAVLGESRVSIFKGCFLFIFNRRNSKWIKINPGLGDGKQQFCPHLVNSFTCECLRLTIALACVL